jgi:hypothetical protein
MRTPSQLLAALEIQDELSVGMTGASHDLDERGVIVRYATVLDPGSRGRCIEHDVARPEIRCRRIADAPEIHDADISHSAEERLVRVTRADDVCAATVDQLGHFRRTLAGMEARSVIRTWRRMNAE